MAQMTSGDLSLTSTSSQEAEISEYVGYERTLRPQANSSDNAAANIINNNTKYENLPNKSSGPNGNRFDSIKTQYDSALLELSCLRLQHSNTERRCGELATQLNYYQQQYVAAIKQLKSSGGNAFPDVSTENERLKRENNILERKLLQLEGQNIGNRNSNSDSFYCSLAPDERGNYSFYRELLEENEKLKALLAKETKERELLRQELHQLLSEKDGVLLEHQKMSDDLTAANKEVEKYKKDEQIYKKDITTLKLANEELSKRDLLTTCDSSWPKDFPDNKDDFKEIEKLRKNLEKAASEVERATRETEDAKRVRDWTIQQREKIVLERDSVKTLCDNLRKERDKAISDLLAAIRDSEQIKKQKDEAQKEIDVLREKIENNNLDSVTRPSYRMNSYEAEDMLEIELCNYSDGDLGIILDDTNNRHLICGVTSSSPAFGKLKINDVLRKVNNIECQSMNKHMVLNEIRARAPYCTLLVSRTRHSKRHFYTVHLNTRDHINHGLHLESGVFISKIEQNSLAANEPELDVGDRVLSINNKSLEEMQCISDIMKLLNDTQNETITIFGLKNIQDVSNRDAKNRMTTSSAQTESAETILQISNTKHPSKFSELFRKLKFSKSGNVDDHFSQEHDAIAALDSVLSENSSEKSKENLFKRTKRSKKEKEAAAVGTWPRTSILQATQDNPTGTIVQRSEKKRALLSLFTAGPINVDKDDDEVEPENRPPPLPPILTKPKPHVRGPGNAIKCNPNRNSNPVTTASLFQQPTNVKSNAMGEIVCPNYARHSVYGMTDDPMLQDNTKLLQRPAPIMGANARLKLPSSEKYTSGPRLLNTNRYSLNITPTEYYKTTGQQAQQQVINSATDFPGQKHQLYDSGYQKTNALFMPLNAMNASISSRSTCSNQPYSMDIASLKSQNSIDSILSTKSPPISEYAVSNYPKRGVPLQQAVLPITKHSSKFPSDSESISSGTIPSHVTNTNYQLPSSQISTNRHTQLFPSFTQSSNLGMRHIRHSSPLTIPSSQQGSSYSTQYTYSQNDNVSTSGHIGIPTNSTDRMDMDYISSSQSSYLQDYPHPMLQQHHVSHYPPLGLPITGMSGNIGVPSSVCNVVYEGGTFPRKKEHQRLRIPSNPSVASKNSGVKNSSGSIDHYYGSIASTHNPSSLIATTPSPLIHHSAVGSGGLNGGSGRGSPMPHVHVEVLSHGGGKRNSNTPADFICPGDLRRVTIDKSDKSLGITIQCNNNGGGIFVSTVADKSIATRAGLQVGDQLLEVCGINMRAATNEIAGNVLRQCGNSIVMLVQYNPEKFHPTEYDCTSNIEPGANMNHSGSPTPRNSPRPPMRNLPPLQSSPAEPTITTNNCIVPQTNVLLVQKPLKEQSFSDSMENQSDINSSQDIPSSTADALVRVSPESSVLYNMNAKNTPRYVTLHMGKSKNLGIKLFGGNNVGIFVHDVASSSPSDRAGIRKGDQILEYNGVNLRGVTAEYAANEIAKLTETVTMLVQNNLQTLKQIKDESGDSFYIRVGFDRAGDLSENDLRFVKDEVLHVDNTLYNGTYGYWRAWKLEAKGHHKEWGIIPSQSKVEEELRSTEIIEGDTGTARRGSTSARRSFFRRKKHQRSSSRDSTEIASFSNTQLSFFPESGILNEDGAILSYQRVELLNSPTRRPVLIIGPLSECVMHRLIMDFSILFKLCEVTAMDCSQEAMEESLQKNIFVDYRRRGNKFECTTVEAINNASKNDRRHCLLDVSISAIERLQRLRIYPIVLLLRFKSAKQIREIRDYGIDKISAKAAKEMYERALKLESDYKQYISAVIPGVSIKHMCTQIKDAVDKEQDKLLWVPVSNV